MALKLISAMSKSDDLKPNRQSVETYETQKF